MTRESVYHNGINYQVGDIVSMVDAEDGTTYFAQIKGFLQVKLYTQACSKKRDDQIFVSIIGSILWEKCCNYLASAERKQIVSTDKRI